MYQAVSDHWIHVNAPLEGVLPFMYLDSKGYVTTGMGNLIDSPEAAMALPWHTSSGARASNAEIREAWERVKLRSDLAPTGGGSFAGVTSLRLSERDINETVKAKLEEIERDLLGAYPTLDNWPADAQMGVLSMAWAMGAGFPKRFPKFSHAVNALLPDFELAAVESRMVDPIPRNAVNRTLFENAAYVLQRNLDPSKLYYPNVLVKGSRTSGSSGGGAPGPFARSMPLKLPLALVGLAGVAYATRGLWWPSEAPQSTSAPETET